MLKRVLAALGALALVLPVLFFGGQLGADLLVFLVLLLVLWEFAPIVDGEHPVQAFGALVLSGGGLFAMLIWGPHGWHLSALLVAVFSVLTWAMLAKDTPEAGAKVGALAVLGVAYISVPLATIPMVRALDQGLSWVFLILVCTWASDTGAYFAGRAFGNRKLLARISPKKTWAGVWGGVGLTIAVAIGFALFEAPAVPPIHAAILGALIAIVGVVGDLIESMFKRASGIKDTGGIMPGHGGLLDRVDSLLFTMPVAWCYIRLMGLV